MSERVEDLVAEFLERRERGEVVDAADFARKHPSVAAELARALAQVAHVESRFASAVAVDVQQFGPYRVVAELGRGAMGRVLRAVDARDESRQLALKVLDGAHALSPRARERFEREAATLRALSHPNVVRVVDADTAASLPWLAMELVEGRTLADLLARARSGEPASALPIAHAASLGLQLARAIEAVHAAGVLHRDVKPSNAILRDDGVLVLVDFGLAHDETARTLTRTGDLIGTPQYMAPEQARGERADERTDIWGVAAVLYELLALRAPHGDGEPLEILARLRTRPVTRLCKVAPLVPSQLERVVMRALAPKRARRTASAAALAADLTAFLAGERVAARTVSLAERVENLWTYRRGWLVAGALACALVPIAWQARDAHLRDARARDDDVMARVLDAWLEDDEEATASIARELNASGEHAEWAQLLCAALEERDPAPSTDAAVARAGEGWRATREKRFAEGISALQEARTLAPSSTAPVVLLARAAERAGELELAAREYRAVIERLPASAEAHANLSDVHYARKDDLEGEREIRRALELDPLDEDHHFDLARLLGRQKRFAESAEAGLRGQGLAGDAITSKQLEVVAAGLDRSERHEEARAVLRRLIEREPRNWSAHYNLAYSFLLDHHLVEARDELAKLTQPGHRERGLALLAWLYAGCNFASCDKCRAAYAEHPELRDAELAERHALDALANPQMGEVPGLAATVAVLTDRRDKIRARLEELQAAEQDDVRIAIFERALRQVRAPKK